MSEILEPLVTYSALGCPVMFGDGSTEDFCPQVLMFSSDVEEQYVFDIP